VETISPYRDIIELIKESGGDAVKLCYLCGLCDTVCPWNRIRKLSVRKIIREAQLGFTEIEKEEIWLCTTCGRCPDQCPRDVRQLEDIMALRRIATKYGVFPVQIRPVRTAKGGLIAQGNPFGEERNKRGNWAEDLSLRKFKEGMEFLYFPGCYLCYDQRLKKVARATANLLKRTGLDFGILGEEEKCCGESIRKTGDEELFKSLARGNIKTFIDYGVKKIIVSSPHCYHTFKNEYTEFMVNFEVFHISQILFMLVKEGKLSFRGKYRNKVTYHDPCYLGRHNGIYNEPREVLKKVPGLELLEMEESLKGSLCCGMGGGRIWMETKKEERFSNLRLKQAIETGANVLATCCPYCITAFEDSVLVLNYSHLIKVRDITEILEEAI
jgi:Fe-S oxidoreductase